MLTCKHLLFDQFAAYNQKHTAAVSSPDMQHIIYKGLLGVREDAVEAKQLYGVVSADQVIKRGDNIVSVQYKVSIRG